MEHGDYTDLNTIGRSCELVCCLYLEESVAGKCFGRKHPNKLTGRLSAEDNLVELLGTSGRNGGEWRCLEW